MCGWALYKESGVVRNCARAGVLRLDQKSGAVRGQVATVCHMIDISFPSIALKRFLNLEDGIKI
jgi:hypothetical protein